MKRIYFLFISWFICFILISVLFLVYDVHGKDKYRGFYHNNDEFSFDFQEGVKDYVKDNYNNNGTKKSTKGYTKEQIMKHHEEFEKRLEPVHEKGLEIQRKGFESLMQYYQDKLHPKKERFSDKFYQRQREKREKAYKIPTEWKPFNKEEMFEKVYQMERRLYEIRGY